MNLLFFPVIISLSQRNVKVQTYTWHIGIYNTSVIIFCVIHALAYFKQEISYIMTRTLLSWTCIGTHILSFATGERSEVFHWNRGEQPDERAQDRSPLFLVIMGSYLLVLRVKLLKNCELMLRVPWIRWCLEMGNFPSGLGCFYYFWAVYWVANCLLHYSLASVLIPGSFLSSPLLDSCAVY
jgi:hypothetical protein